MTKTTTIIEWGRCARVSSPLVRFVCGRFGGLGYDHECTCIVKNGENTVCRTCGSACHHGQ